MKTFTHQLPDTKAELARWLEWTIYTKPGYLCGGVLTIAQNRKGSPISKVDRYAVQEIVTTVRGERHFRLSQPMALGKETYFVCLHIKPAGKDECVCKGYESTGSCKHVIALRLMHLKGWLPVGHGCPPQHASHG